MKELRFYPVGKAHPTKAQVREQYIKCLRRWVAVLAFADIIYTMLAIALIYEVLG